HEERIPDPSRVFLDLPFTRAATPLVDRTLRFDRDADVVRQVRIGRHPNATTRIVLDAVGVSSYSVYALYHPYRLVIDCARATDADNSQGSALFRLSPSAVRPSATAARSSTADSRLSTVDSRSSVLASRLASR